jgi:hypothetical protein
MTSEPEDLLVHAHQVPVIVIGQLSRQRQDEGQDELFVWSPPSLPRAGVDAGFFMPAWPCTSGSLQV